MLYDSYELRMQNIAKIKNTILKYKVLIITLISMLMLTLATISFMNGIITNDLTSVSSVVYGEKISLDAKVMFKKATYEFRTVGSGEWSSTEPILPGEYEVRVVSRRSFGIKSSGDAVSFTILPKNLEVSVQDEVLMYGNDFSFKAELNEGDYFVSGEADYTDFVLQTDIKPISDTLVIFNANGDNVSSAYNFTEVTTSIQFIPRDITVQVVEKEKVYDGLEFVSDEYTITNLLQNHNEHIEIVGSIKNNGTTVNEIVNTKIMCGDIDISHMYNITKINSTLTILKKDITISSESDEKVYDGTELFNLNFTHTDLISGDIITVINKPSITYFGTIQNNLEVTILNSDNINNYNIIYINGTLEITKKELLINSVGKEITYNGMNLSNKEITYNVDDLMIDDVITIIDFTEIKYVGEIDNELIVSIFNGDADVTQSYSITYSYQKLIVVPREVVVTTTNYSEVYNGEVHFQLDHTVNNIVSGDVSEVIDYTKITNVGTVDNVITIKILSNGIDISDSYVIEYEVNKIEVTQRLISIITKSDEKQYDGTPLTNDGWDYNNTVLSLVDGHILQTFNDGTITEVDDDNIIGLTDNTNSNYRVTSAGIDVTSNYEFDIKLGVLKILQREVTIETNSAKKNYDDTILVKNELDDFEVISEQTFVLNHELKINIIGEALNVVRDSEGNVIGIDNSWDSFTITSGTNDVKKNYNVTVVCGKLTIYPRMISIKAESDDKIYDGDILELNEWKYIGIDEITEVVDGHRLEAVITGSITDVGTISNVIESASVFKGSENVTYNYIIALNNGKLEITHRELYITTDSLNEEYNDVEHKKHSFTYDEGSLHVVEGQELKLIYTASITDVGSTDNTYSNASVYLGTDEKTRNYKIYVELGSLVVYERTITIDTNDNEFIYDGTAQYDENYTINRLVDGHESFIVNVVGEENVIQDGKNKYEVSIMKDGVIKDRNYKFVYTYGTLTITKRVVSIKTDSDEKVYDGTPLVMDSWNYLNSENEFVNSLHTFDLAITGTLTNVEYDSEGNVTYVINGDNGFTLLSKETNDDVSSNYQVIISHGTLQVNKRDLNVKLYSVWKIYDGKELTSDEFYFINDTSLALNEVFSVEITGSITNVGKVDNVHNAETIKVLKSDGMLSTLNYDITVEDGKLEVYYREVNIKTGSKSKIYDGEELSYDYWYYSESENEILTELNHSLKVDIVGSIINVGEQANELRDSTQPYVINEDGSINENYIVTYSAGKLEVKQRQVSIKAEDDEKIYDGEILFNYGWDYTIIDNDQNFEILDIHINDIIVTNTSYRINAGVGLNIITKFVIVNEFITNNYNIIIEDGQLEIFKREVKIETNEASIEYNGEILFNKNLKVEQQLLDRGLLDIHVISIVDYSSIYLVERVLNEVTVEIMDGDTNVSSNYEIQYKYEKYLEITPKDITVVTQNDSKTYDGYLLSNTELDNSILVANDEYKILDFTEIYSHTEGTDNEIIVGILGFYENRVIDVTHCYNIGYDYGTFVIEKKIVRFTTESMEKDYDSVVLFNKQLHLDLALTDKYEITFFETVTYYTEEAIPNIIEFDVIHSEYGKVNDNYNFDPLYGTLQINKKDVYITTGSNGFEYDGNAHQETTCVIKDGKNNDFVFYDWHVINYLNFVTNVSDGEVENAIEVEILEVAKDSYNITVFPGIIKILPSEITIYLQYAEKVYDGTPLTSNLFILDRELPGIVIEIDTNGSRTNAGEGENEILTHRIISGDASNYVFAYEDNVLVVTKYTVTISTGSDYKEYDGTPLTCDETTHTILIGNDEISYTVTGWIVDYGSEDNTISDVVFIVGNSANYDIVEDFGVLTILQRKLIIKTADMESIYIDEELKAEDYTVYDEYYNELPDFRIELIFLNSIRNVGQIQNEATVADEEIYNNYDIEIIPGILEIIPREITIETLSNLEIVYDGTEQTYLEYKVLSTLDILEFHLVRFIDPKVVQYYDGVSYVNFFILQPYKVEDGQEIEVHNNYVINVEIYGNIKIIKRDLHISAEGGIAKVEYNGFEQGVTPDSLSYDNLPDGQYPRVTTNEGKLLPCDPVEIEYTVEIFDIDGKNVSNNYNITQEKCYLQIVKMTLIVATATFTSTYNGQEQYSNIADILVGQLAECDTFYFTGVTKALFPNVYENKYTGYEFYSPHGMDISDLYNLRVESLGIITIKEVDLHIVTNSIEQEYDGFEYSDNGWDYHEFSTFLLDGHVLKIYGTPSVKDVIYDKFGIVTHIDNNYEILEIVDGEGNDVSMCYDLIVDIGILKILPKVLNVVILNVQKPYQNTLDYVIEHQNYKYYRVDTEDLLGHTLEIDVIESGITKDITLKTFRVTKDNFDNTSNFEVQTDSNSGKINYTKRQIELIAGSVTTEYTGAVIFTQEYDMKGDSLMDGHTISVIITGYRQKIGTTTTQVSSISIKDKDGNELVTKDEFGKFISEYYDFTTINGFITIT